MFFHISTSTMLFFLNIVLFYIVHHTKKVRTFVCSLCLSPRRLLGLELWKHCLRQVFNLSREKIHKKTSTFLRQMAFQIRSDILISLFDNEVGREQSNRKEATIFKQSHKHGIAITRSKKLKLVQKSNHSMSFSFEFCRHLSNKEVMEWPLFFLYWRCVLFRERRKDVRIWSMNPSEGFSCKSFYRLLLDPSPIGEFAFNVVWRIKIPKQVRYFIWQVLLGRVNTVGRLASYFGIYECLDQLTRTSTNFMKQLPDPTTFECQENS